MTSMFTWLKCLASGRRHRAWSETAAAGARVYEAFPGLLGEGLPAASEGTVPPCERGGTESSPAIPIRATADLPWRLRHWPHRCVFLGDGIQAWLVGLTSRSVPLALALNAGLTLIVTHGQVEIVCGGYPSCLGQGQSLVLSGGEMTRIDTGTEADVLMVIAACGDERTTRGGAEAGT